MDDDLETFERDRLADDQEEGASPRTAPRFGDRLREWLRRTMGTGTIYAPAVPELEKLADAIDRDRDLALAEDRVWGASDKTRQHGCVTNFDHAGVKWSIWRHGNHFTLAPFGVFAQQHQWTNEPLFQSIAAEVYRLACKVGLLRRQRGLDLAAAGERHPELLEELEDARKPIGPPQVHELKTWPAEFQAVLDGKKRHETRRNDPSFQTGDTAVLKEWQPGQYPHTARPFYTGRELTFTVGHVTAGPSWGLPEDLVVFTLLDSPPPLALLTPSPMAETWRIEGEDGAAGLDVAIEPDGTLFLAPLEGRIPSIALHPQAASALRNLLAEAAQSPTTGLSFRADREATADRAAEGDEPGRVEGVDRG